MTSALARALRAKFPRQRDALRALGLDENLLDIDRGRVRRRRALQLAFDASGPDTVRKHLDEHLQGPALEKAQELCSREHDEAELARALEDLFAQNLNGYERMRAMGLLENLSKHDRDESVFDEEEDRELIEGMLDRAEEFLRSRGIGDDDVEEFRRLYDRYIRDEIRGRRARDSDMPRNGLGQDRRHRKMARDTFSARWAEASRIGDCGGGDYYGEPFAMDQQDSVKAATGFEERWGDLANRISNAGGGW